MVCCGVDLCVVISVSLWGVCVLCCVDLCCCDICLCLWCICYVVCYGVCLFPWCGVCVVFVWRVWCDMSCVFVCGVCL